MPVREAGVQHQSVCRELRQNLVVEAAAVLPHQVADDARDRVELCFRGHAVRRSLDDAGGHLPLEAGDPHLIELVEVAAEDAEELEALEQGGARVQRLVQHPAVELQPGELAVDVERRVPQIQGGRQGRGEPEVGHAGNVLPDVRGRT
jgi:hypothetical protein